MDLVGGSELGFAGDSLHATQKLTVSKKLFVTGPGQRFGF
jgi:hypothetical protein